MRTMRSRVPRKLLWVVGAILLILSAGLLFLATLGADEPPRRREAPAEA